MKKDDFKAVLPLARHSKMGGRGVREVKMKEALRQLYYPPILFVSSPTPLPLLTPPPPELHSSKTNLPLHLPTPPPPHSPSASFIFLSFCSFVKKHFLPPFLLASIFSQ